MGNDTEQGVLGHARAREIKKAIGSEKFEELHTIAFLRNPYSKLVSSYFFNKKNNLSQVFGIKGNKNKLKRIVNSFLSILIAKILPFQLWAFIYPYRSNISYVTDYDGTLIIKHLGRTECLNEDFHAIMNHLNIDATHIQVGNKNTSKHKSYDEYFKNKWFYNKMYLKMKTDIDLYNSICKKMN